MQGLARLQESFAHFGQNTLFLLSHYPSPRIGISHGGLRKFGYEAGKIPPPPHTCVETKYYIP